MNFTDPVHKKVIGYIFIIFSALGLLILAFYEQFIDIFISMIQDEPGFDSEVMWIFQLISSIVWGVAIIFYIPRLIIGIGLVNQRKWANIPALIYGIISLLNVPIGTLLGIYSILVFTSKERQGEHY